MSNEVNLSARLLAAAGFVKSGVTLADIGTDHAFLPAYLVLNGALGHAVASDVKEGPLKNAAETLRRFSLADRIELRLSDGLDAYSPDDAGQFVFAGMGGTLTTELMARAPWLKSSAYNLVFQPQSRAEELRCYLYSNGFCIKSETAVSEGRCVYIALNAVYDGVVRDSSPEKCFTGELAANADENARRFFKKEYQRIKNKYDGVLSSDVHDTSEAEKLKKILEAIGGII